MKTVAKIKAIAFISITLLMVAWFGMSFKNLIQDGKKKPWVVPDKSKNITNPVKSTPESITAGKNLYNKHCKSCHGAKGLGDGPKSQELKTPSGDFSIKEFQSQTDGELLYKIKEGRDDMPSFKKKIPEDDDVWSVVNYVRTMAAK